jgi:hypothetical protein
MGGMFERCKGRGMPGRKQRRRGQMRQKKVQLQLMNGLVAGLPNECLDCLGLCNYF